MLKLYKSFTTDIRRTGIIKRHNNDNTNKKVKNTEKSIPRTKINSTTNTKSEMPTATATTTIKNLTN